MKLSSALHMPVAVVVLALVHGCSSAPSQRQPTPVVEHGRPAAAQHPSIQPQVPVYTSAPGTPAAVATSRQPAAVVALLQQAEQQANGGDLESAAASLERAIRIDPHNPILWYHLATVRLSQGEPSQAEQLANKSNSLAPGNYAQQARNWLLIAQARRQLNDSPGAAVAEQRARELGAR
ncbi:MAG: tetratricopeptide repeat protein [Gammaproteobacteria bacterium]|nr:tetratricopeptide repeat protein [Gammaproteobacteria bacterium]